MPWRVAVCTPSWPTSTSSASIQVASGLAKINVGDVGEMVAAAIENNQFFVLTHPEVGASMVARAAEPDHYLAEAIAQLPEA